MSSKPEYSTPSDCTEQLAKPLLPPPVEKLTTKLVVTLSKYATSLDTRGYIPVYEYTVNSQAILWDRETGYVFWTGIWKALGREKNEIAKLVDADPVMSKVVKKIRGGYLKIQGTWIPFPNARKLAVRTCYPIREELAVIFGPDFVQEALEPNHPGYIRAPPINLEARRIRAENSANKALQSRKKKVHLVSNLKQSKKSTLLPQPYPKWNSQNQANPRSNSLTNQLNLPSLPQTGTKMPSLSSLLNYEPRETYQLPPIKLHYSSGEKRHYPSVSSSPQTTSSGSNLDSFAIVSCSDSFYKDKKDLDDAIAASLLLQKLSQDDGTEASRQKVILPPASFSIGQSKFEWFGSSYRPI